METPLRGSDKSKPSKLLIMITKLLILFALVAAGLLLLVTVQSSDFRIARTARIPAPVTTVFAQVNDLRQWAVWSP